MNRRYFLGRSLALAAAPLAFPALAQSTFAPAAAGEAAPDPNAKPYMEIGNFTDDKERVFLFFSYECPFCAQYVPPIIEWAKTFPKPLQLVQVPVIGNDMASRAGALAYYIVRELAPERIAELDSLAFNAAGFGIRPDTFPALLRQMQFSDAEIQTTLNKTVTKNRMRRAIVLFERYKVNATPHFGIAGRYATNVTYTGGNYQALMQLLNGLVSQALQQK